jgi:tetratricopeptide (TPR) repeat protein
LPQCGEAGRHDEALEPIQRAVEIYKRLAKQNPAAYEPDLAMSLNNLSIRLAEAGRRDEALRLVHRALDLIRPYAIPGTTYASWMAFMEQSLSNLRP